MENIFFKRISIRLFVFLLTGFFVYNSAALAQNPGSGEISPIESKISALLDSSLYMIYTDIEKSQTLLLEAENIIATNNTLDEQWLKHIQSDIFLAKASIFRRLGIYDESLFYLDLGLKNARMQGDNQNEELFLDQIAMINVDNGNFAEAIAIYKEQVNFKKNDETASPEELTIVLGNMGIVFWKAGQYDSSLRYYRLAFENLSNVEKTKPDNRDVLARKAWLMDNIGLIHQKKENYDSSFFYFRHSLSIRNQIDHEEGKMVVMTNMAKGYLHKQLYAKAEKYADSALVLAKKLQYNTYLPPIYKIKADINFQLGKYKKAFISYKQYHSLEDSLDNDFLQEKALKISTSHNYLKKIKTDSLLHSVEKSRQELIIKEQNLQITYQSRQKIFFIIIAVLIGFIALIFFRNYKIKKRDHALIAEKKKLIENQKNELLETYNQLKAKNIQIVDSIRYAKHLQTAILPNKDTIISLFSRSFILYKPKAIVSGDFFWAEKRNEFIFAAVSDCTGHGVPGAMVSVICNTALNRTIYEFNLNDPGKILEKTRELVVEAFSKSGDSILDGMDISLITFNIKERKMFWAGANNPIWIVKKSNQELLEIKGDRQAIGFSSKYQPFTTHEINVEKDDMIYLLSDGYQDQFGGEKDKKFMSKYLKKILVSLAAETESDQLKLLEKRFEEWKGDYEQTDDICLMGIRIGDLGKENI